MADGTSSRCIALLLLLAMAARADSVVTDGLLPNGNFEEGPSKSELNGTMVTGRYSIPNWEISGFVEYIESGKTQEGMILAVPEGARAVRLGNDGTIRQRLSVTRKTYYSITFSAARTCAQAERLNVSAAPESGILPIQTLYTSSGWDSYSYAFKARHSTVWFTIHNPGVEEDPACGPLIDSVAIKTLHRPHRVKGNMLKNGDFEEGPYIFPNSPWGVLVPPMDEDVVSPLPGWMIMSDTKAVKYVDATHFAVPHGSYAVELVAGTECALVQEVSTLTDRTYKLSFSVGDAANGCNQPLVVKAYAARSSLEVTYVSQGMGGSKRAELEFAAVSNLTRVVFQSMNHYMKPDGTLCGPVVDDISLVSVHKHAARRLFM
ncbi:BIIDXI-like protein At5g11420 [Phragmites australis]|uniref:BIIDXI-like protein At5g11420 n=1 Tax=Phragmites australis TaxID=29695 RepID=UPI002D789D93|nr:BIIDXI-like protein At5g11420 [Phragmites australis]